jgi:hypothetical protein
MALGVIRVRGNVCKYSSKAPNKRMRGKFTRCAGKRITGGRKKASSSRRRKSSASGSKHCVKKVVSTYGNKRCRTVCTKNGKRLSSTPASGCKW